MNKQLKKDHWNWLEIFTKANDDVSKRIMANFEEIPSAPKTYKAVFGFMPCPFINNTAEDIITIASLIKLFSTKRSGHNQEVREQIQCRFKYLDPKIQKKILCLFLDGSKQDRIFCYNELSSTWDKTFSTKIIELWEKYHEHQSARLIVFNCDISYVRNHEDELTQAVGYFYVCWRLSAEDKNYVINKHRLSRPLYARILYLSNRKIGRKEAIEILWATISDSIITGICKICHISYYFRLCDSLNVPSICWDDHVMNCMRYLYYVAPKEVLAEAMLWDMNVGNLFEKLFDDDGYQYMGDKEIEKLRNMKVFLKLAYAMLPEDKKRYLKNNDSLPNYDKERYSFSSTLTDESIDYTEDLTKDLLKTIKDFHLTENIPQEEWETIYKNHTQAQMRPYQKAIDKLGLTLVCPKRQDFIKALLYEDV